MIGGVAAAAAVADGEVAASAAAARVFFFAPSAAVAAGSASCASCAVCVRSECQTRSTTEVSCDLFALSLHPLLLTSLISPFVWRPWFLSSGRVDWQQAGGRRRM